MILATQSSDPTCVVVSLWANMFGQKCMVSITRNVGFRNHLTKAGVAIFTFWKNGELKSEVQKLNLKDEVCVFPGSRNTVKLTENGIEIPKSLEKFIDSTRIG